jgi:hypothetical protein
MFQSGMDNCDVLASCQDNRRGTNRPRLESRAGHQGSSEKLEFIAILLLEDGESRRSLTSGPDRHNALRQIEAAQRKLRRAAVRCAHRIFEIDLPRLARQQ